MTMEKLDILSDLDLKSFPMEFDESPTTAISTLPRLSTPLPPADDTTWIEVHSPEWGVDREHIRAPAAPVMKDLDSFTEGTGKGSFDSILDDTTNEPGELFYHPDLNSDSLGLMPELDPNLSLSIEMWREEVYFDTPLDLPPRASQGAELQENGFTREAIDAADSFSEINLGSEDLVDSIDDGPRMQLYIPTPSSMIESSIPRVLKRARSRTPEPSRRTRPRPRSKSLSSIRSTGHIFASLSSAPPWRTEHFLDNYLHPFD